MNLTPLLAAILMLAAAMPHALHASQTADSAVIERDKTPQAENLPTGLMTDLVKDAHKVYRNGFATDMGVEELTADDISDYTFAAIRSSRPTFGWIVPDCGRATRQKSYRIVLSDNMTDALARRGNIWDSGTVRSTQSVAVDYGGNSLEPDRLYFWSVQVATDRGGRSEWSDIQSFRTASELEQYVPSYRPQVRREELAARIERLDSETTLLDFGRASFASLRVSLESATGGDTVYVAIGEAMKQGRIDPRPGGTIRYYRYPVVLQRGRRTYDIIPAHDGRNTGSQAVLMPDYIGEVAPFRYCQIENYAGSVDADDVVRLTVTYPFDTRASHFVSDNAALNEVWNMCRYTIEATSALGIYIDGDRERIPYEADAIINQLGHYAVDREYAMARRTSEYLLQHPTWPTEWILQALIIAWNDYLYTGDLRSVEQNYDLLSARTLRSLRRDNGLISTRIDDTVSTDAFRRSIRFNGNISDIVDWPRGSEDDNYVFTPYNTVVNAFHYRAMQLLARMAEALGRHDEARELNSYCDAFRHTFNAAMIDPTTGTYRDGIDTDHRSLHANLFPLAFGLVPEEYERSVVDYIRSRGMACSVYAAQFLLDGLYDMAEGDYALHLLTKDDIRSWRNMIRAGATITFEAWDNSFKPNQDWNHAWGAAPADIIPMRLVGVRPLTPSAATIEVRPQTASLRHVTAAVPTIRGTVEVDIDRTDNLYRMRVRIPANTDARILLPAPDHKYILRRNGRRIHPRKSGNGAFVDAGTVASGEYIFTLERAR